MAYNNHNNNNDRTNLLLDLISDLRGRMENMEREITRISGFIDLPQQSSNFFSNPFNFTQFNSNYGSNRSSLFNTRDREPRRNNFRFNRENYTTATPTTAATPVRNTTTGTGDTYDSIFTSLLLDPIFTTLPRTGLTIEQLNANTTVETWNRDTDASEEEVEGELETDSCCICREPFTEETVIRKLNRCSHKFHISCIDTWLQSNTTCPLCRSSVRPLLIDITSDRDNENRDNRENSNRDNDNVRVYRHRPLSTHI
jgi:hypothetical protein